MLALANITSFLYCVIIFLLCGFQNVCVIMMMMIYYYYFWAVIIISSNVDILCVKSVVLSWFIPMTVPLYI